MHIEINLAAQRLRLLDGAQIKFECVVSTARNGAGEKRNSECTPRGQHVIDAKIGAGEAVNTVFVNRQPTGEIYSPALRAQHPPRDWILTRILWLRGMEAGFNSGGDCDSKERYIYIHGAPDDVPMGVLGSRGCVRLRNADLLHLFAQVAEGTPVTIQE